MNFSLSEDLLALRRNVHDVLAGEVDLAPLLKPSSTVEQAGYDKLWPKLVELGWNAIVVPEAYGGLGMTLLDLSVVATECGRFLAAAPLFGTLGGAWAIELAGSEPQKARLLGEVAGGTLKLALALPELDDVCGLCEDDLIAAPVGGDYRLTGVRDLVVDAAAADKIVVISKTSEGERGWAC